MLILQSEYKLQAADSVCTKGRQDISHRHCQTFLSDAESCQQMCSGSWEQLLNLCALQCCVVEPSSALETCKRKGGKSLKRLKYQPWLSKEHSICPQLSLRHTLLSTSLSSRLQPSFQRWMTTFCAVVW